MKKLFAEMESRFPGSILVFDCCNRRRAKMMTKTWLKEAGISNVDKLMIWFCDKCVKMSIIRVQLWE